MDKCELSALGLLTQASVKDRNLNLPCHIIFKLYADFYQRIIFYFLGWRIFMSKRQQLIFKLKSKNKLSSFGLRDTQNSNLCNCNESLRREVKANDLSHRSVHKPCIELRVRKVFVNRILTILIAIGCGTMIFYLYIGEVMSADGRKLR